MKIFIAAGYLLLAACSEPATNQPIPAEQANNDTIVDQPRANPEVVSDRPKIKPRTPEVVAPPELVREESGRLDDDVDISDCYQVGVNECSMGQVIQNEEDQMNACIEKYKVETDIVQCQQRWIKKMEGNGD